MLSAAFSPLPPLDALGLRWRALEEQADCSFFLGWTWMESWLAATGARPELLAIQNDGQDVALALVGRSMTKRLLGRTATLWLNQSGDARIDRAYIEYNGILKARGAADDIDARALAALAARNDWRALRLPGVADGAPLAGAGRFRRRVLIDRSPAYFADLGQVRAAGGGYLSLLSANTRSQIKRAAKDHGTDGPEIAVARPEDVPGWLGEMQALNTGRHEDNAWADPMFVAFVQRIAETGMPRGEVEIMRFTVSGAVLGLLVNFVYRGRAMNYQSAFAQPKGPKDKPGLLCHAAAVERYAAAGLDLYSLLAGKDRYKQSLSTGSETLEWWSLERFSLRLEAEALLRRLLRRPASV
jgi:CelD/BcsL family acetyltransferase involved in cellulose biosynthesis